MNALTYLIEVNAYLVIFYGFYLLLLRKETFFNLNRIYLVSSALISLIIPVLKSDWLRELFVTARMQEFTKTVKSAVTSVPMEYLTEIPVVERPLLSTEEWFLVIYIVITLGFFLNFLRKLYLIKKILNQEDQGIALSFFKKITIDKNLQGQETIMKHEMVHAKQWHSADVIFFELIAVFNWFNPIIYLYKKAIQGIHEYIADDIAACTMTDKSQYALLLVSNAFNTEPQQLVNNFFNQSILKRRIIMLNKTKSKRVAILKYGLSVPLFLGLVILSSATDVDTAVVKTIASAVTPLIEPLPSAKLEPIDEVIPQFQGISENSIIPIVEEYKNAGAPFNLVAYINKLSSVFNEDKDGLITFSYKVDENKQITKFKLEKGIGSKWEKTLMALLPNFDEEVDMAPGTYIFNQGYVRLGNEHKFNLTDDNQKGPTLNWITLNPVIGGHSEIKKGKMIHVDYILNNGFKDPVVLVNGKKVSYTSTTKGLRLDEPIEQRLPEDKNDVFYVTTVADSHFGDEAVEKYNESARQGLIRIACFKMQGNKIISPTPPKW